MGFEEDRSANLGLGTRGLCHPPDLRSDLIHRPGVKTSLREGWCLDPPESLTLIRSLKSYSLVRPRWPLPRPDRRRKHSARRGEGWPPWATAVGGSSLTVPSTALRLLGRERLLRAGGARLRWVERHHFEGRTSYHQLTRWLAPARYPVWTSPTGTFIFCSLSARLAHSAHGHSAQGHSRCSTSYPTR
jgi:hypothetical protein